LETAEFSVIEERNS